MFLLRRPSAHAIEAFLRQSQHLELSYDPVGLVSQPARGYDIDETVAVIGRGPADFERAKAALLGWKQFGLGWAELFPRGAPTTTDTAVAVLVRHLGFWSLSGCRVVYETGARDGGNRFGYAYGTLTNHVESGEELFEVAFDPQSTEVTYRIHAVSRPRAPLAMLGYPVARLLQARFRRDSVKAMRLAV
jgi:uncharacterized protein (UPF0548 family)